ncbi:MAG: hypothetical protein J07HX5_00251 [halophilic archaeon J07HX5]|nr:MAG: hypothetical protein J07HX5_00251 [halophilic archaeon J07HX5]
MTEDTAGEDRLDAVPQARDSAAMFSLLGDEVRLEIITTLHEGAPLSFSDLYDQMTLGDTGQFNYHLSRLRTHFVRKREDTYVLTAAGQRIARAVAAGFYTDAPEISPFEIDGACTTCDTAALVASYADERFRIEYAACEVVVVRVSVPPSLVRGREPAAALEAFERWASSQLSQARRGLCPDCGGWIDRTITTETPPETPFAVLPRFACGVCGRDVITSFGALAVRDERVQSFHRRHGVALDDRRYWEIDQFVTDEYTKILSEAPLRVQVRFAADDEVCRVVLDDDHEVRTVEVVSDC